MSVETAEPLLLYADAHASADFRYATGMRLEGAAYLRFAPGEDVLLVAGLELDRARAESSASRVIDRVEAGWYETTNTFDAWTTALARVAQEHGTGRLLVPRNFPAGLFVSLRDAGLDLVIDPGLLVAERRQKSKEEQGWIHAAQRAAEAGCVEVIRRLAEAEVRDEMLWEHGTPLTSEHLIAAAAETLQELGYETGEPIVAGSPGCALPHHRGTGQIRAGHPVVIDISPRGGQSGYHGDLTRTVVVGEPESGWQAISQAVLAAFEAGAKTLKAGANGRDAHRAASQALVDAGYGTLTVGYEGGDGPRMNHGLGHGVGLDVHEPPQLRDLDYPLQAGDVVTIEPGLYEVGAGAVRWEDLGVVEEHGFRNFTSLPKSLNPLDYL